MSEFARAEALRRAPEGRAQVASREEAGHAQKAAEPRRLALEFLRGERQLSDAVLVGLHQELVDPQLIGRIVRAQTAGARLASGLAPGGLKDGRSMRQLLADPAFDWGGADRERPERQSADREPAIGPESGTAAHTLGGLPHPGLEHKPQEESEWQRLVTNVLGLIPLERLPRVIRLARAQAWPELVSELGELGIDAYHSAELIEIASAKLGQHAIATTAEGAARTLVPVAAMAFWVKGLIEVGRAHEAGDAQAMAVNYAQAFAEVLVAALCDGRAAAFESSGIPELDEARGRARAEAFAALSRMSPTERAIAAARLRAESQDPGNARRAIAEDLLRRAGYEGLVFHRRTEEEQRAEGGVR
jgi:hypothetical protein